MLRRLVAIVFAAAVVLAAAPAGAATRPVSDFTGAAASHAVRITVGNLELTVGGGQSNAAFETAGATIRNVRADAHGNGLVVPGLIDSHVACVPPKLAQSLVALKTPAELAPLLQAQLGAANCAISITKLPSASHSAGEVEAAITLTPSIVGDVSAVNSVLDTIQGQLGSLPLPVRDQAGSVISAIKDRLASDPVLDIKIAPTSGTVTSTKSGIASASPGAAVTLSLLGGVIQIEIAVADATANVVDGVPHATSDVALVHIKALNILTPDPNDALIDQNITAPQSLSILQGTPLATSIATERGTTSLTCGGSLAGYSACASGSADAVALRMLAAPLPTIGVDLIHAQALAAQKSGSEQIGGPSLPRTGAAAGATILAGLALAGGALLTRRYVLR
jgi:hypothetical protein